MRKPRRAHRSASRTPPTCLRALQSDAAGATSAGLAHRVAAAAPAATTRRRRRRGAPTLRASMGHAGSASTTSPRRRLQQMGGPSQPRPSASRHSRICAGGFPALPLRCGRIKLILGASCVFLARVMHEHGGRCDPPPLLHHVPRARGLALRISSPTRLSPASSS
jgi:hypothetical protein